MLDRNHPAGAGKRPLLPWLRFLHLRTYGRTHLSVAWRVSVRPDTAVMPVTAREAETVSEARREMPRTPCVRR